MLFLVERLKPASEQVIVNRFQAFPFHDSEPDDHIPLPSHIQRGMAGVLKEVLKLLLTGAKGKRYAGQGIP